MSTSLRVLLILLGLTLTHLPLQAGDAPDPPPVPQSAVPADGAAAGKPPAETKPEARAVLLRYRLREGDSAAYRVNLEGKGTVTTGGAGISLPMNLAIELAVAQKVVRVREDGAGELLTITSCKRAQLNNLDFPGIASSLPEVTAVMAPTGQIVSLKAAKGAAAPSVPGVDAGSLTAVTQRLAFPDRPVKVGETWSAGDAEGQYRATTTLLGIAEEKGRQIARLKQVFAMPIQAQAPALLNGGTVDMSGRQAGDLIIRFDQDAGKIAEVTGTVDSAVTLGKAAGMGMNLRVRLNLRMESVAPAPEKE